MTTIMNTECHLEFFKNNISETSSVSAIRYKGRKVPTQVAPLEIASLNHYMQRKLLSRVYILLTYTTISGRQEQKNCQ
jgi:hypothetical protein